LPLQAALFRDVHGPQGALLQGVVAQTALLGAQQSPAEQEENNPIASNYFKRMRALGLAAASLEQAFHHNQKSVSSITVC